MPARRLNINTARRIIAVYQNREINNFPRIMDYYIKPRQSWIEFEWLEGNPITDNDLQQAFFTLGAMHKTFRIKGSKNSVYTLCHGDVHKNNILKAGNKIMFIDTLYTHVGWNYTDLDYVDLYDLFDKAKYPWIIKDRGIIDSYFEGLEMKLISIEKELFRKKAAVYALKKYIKNGINNDINIFYEKKCLRKISE